MNERIRELAEQAGAKFLKNVAVVADNGSSGLATDFIPAFAELIIEECYKQITQDPFNSYAAGAWLKQHFEVEK